MYRYPPLNYDDVGSEERTKEILLRLETRKVDISCVEETHNTDRKYFPSKYCIRFTPSYKTNGKIGKRPAGIGGFAIIIRKQPSRSIEEICKTPNRITYATLQTNIKCSNIQIINTYAPNMGYSMEERTLYWQEIKEIPPQKLNNKQCVIWTTDNNGQIAKENDADSNNTIGPWTVAQKTEPGNGQMLRKHAKNMRYAPQTRTLLRARCRKGI